MPPPPPQHAHPTREREGEGGTDRLRVQSARARGKKLTTAVEEQGDLEDAVIETVVRVCQLSISMDAWKVRMLESTLEREMEMGRVVKTLPNPSRTGLG